MDSNGIQNVTGESVPREPAAPRAQQILRWALIACGVLLMAGAVAFLVAYHRLAKRVDQQLTAGPFSNATTYYAAPELISVGDSMSPAELADTLKHTGLAFSASRNGFRIDAGTPVEIDIANHTISSIVNLSNGARFNQYQLPPQLLTNFSNEGRAKRIMIHYSDLPPSLVYAIISAEDKRFFAHSGFDGLRIAKAVYVDVREHRKEQGASTISMQLARNLWLERDKSWRRKLAEAMITMHLEQKLSKQQILEDYCNAVYLGGRATFSINGFGEAAQVYFAKDIHKLTLPEAALLAGLIQRPSYYNPVRYPRRALERRNAVLTLMRENKYINQAEWEQAVNAPLGLRLGGGELAEAQYFLDLAADDAARKLESQQVNGPVQVYTTIDMRLQRAAEQALADGMQLVDRELAGKRKPGQRTHAPQVALIALDPHTGEVRALCGGRNYVATQLDRVVAKRPPGSVFKPFVYAAALNTAVSGGDRILTQASTVADSPTTFQYDRNLTYSPANFKNEFWGTVSLRRALAHSLNVATVKVGEMVGFQNVVALAHAAGMNEDIKPTPAVALGAYQVTPFEIARAYTIFANNGVLVQSTFTSEIRSEDSAELYHHVPETKPVLDQRVAFLMVDMLQEVMRSGTAAGVRARGFRLPAAGKTGTSHDGWFAGFTSQLLCVVWVGFDDYSELGLEGARSALPIWTEFMMQAARYKQYGNASEFSPPPGVVRVVYDPQSGKVAGPFCPEGVAAYFIDGTQPTGQCVPEQVELVPTVDGGFTERTVSVQTPLKPPDKQQ